MDQTPLDPNPNAAPCDPLQDKPKPAAWTLFDSWLGLALLILLVGAYSFAVFQFGKSQSMGLFIVATFEFILLIPIAAIFLFRNISWMELGLRPFDRKDLALGCALLAGVYVLVIINNRVMAALGATSQAEVASDMLGKINSPYLFAFTTVIVTPIAEELFFRGFLFKGFRQKYGWVNAMLLSSLFFALLHGQVAALIPTFLLGSLFAYLYQRSESVFPGMFLHFIVNLIGVCALLVAHQMGAL